jgi:hypothetical protein
VQVVRAAGRGARCRWQYEEVLTEALWADPATADRIKRTAHRRRLRPVRWALALRLFSRELNLVCPLPSAISSNVVSRSCVSVCRGSSAAAIEWKRFHNWRRRHVEQRGPRQLLQLKLASGACEASVADTRTSRHQRHSILRTHTRAARDTPRAYRRNMLELPATATDIRGHCGHTRAPAPLVIANLR